MIIPEAEAPGWMSDNDLTFLMDIAKDKECVEVGVWKGRTAIHLLQVCKSIVLVDPWEGLETYPNPDFLNDGNVFGQFAMLLSKHYTHRGKYVEIYKKPSALVAREMNPSRQFDLVFIDANHEYDYVLEDIWWWVQKIRNGGWLCGHDYHCTQKPCIKAIEDAIPKLDHLPIGDPDGVWAVRIDDSNRDVIRDRARQHLPNVLERNAWAQQTQ